MAFRVECLGLNAWRLIQLQTLASICPQPLTPNPVHVPPKRVLDAPPPLEEHCPTLARPLHESPLRTRHGVKYSPWDVTRCWPHQRRMDSVLDTPCGRDSVLDTPNTLSPGQDCGWRRIPWEEHCPAFPPATKSELFTPFQPSIDFP